MRRVNEKAGWMAEGRASKEAFSLGQHSRLLASLGTARWLWETEVNRGCPSLQSRRDRWVYYDWVAQEER